MKIKQLFIATSLMALLLSGCEAQKPLTEATAEPVVATAEVTPAATPAEIVANNQNSPVLEHCDEHHSKSAHDCKKHCKESKKGKKDKACKVHCDGKALAEHNCTQHCADHHNEMDKTCKTHCDGKALAEHNCTQHCADHHNEMDKTCKVHCDGKAIAEHNCTEHCADHHNEMDKTCKTHCENKSK